MRKAQLRAATKLTFRNWRSPSSTEIHPHHRSIASASTASDADSKAETIRNSD
jgi:hypothetical protein